MNGPVVGQTRTIIKQMLDICVDNDQISDRDLASMIEGASAGYVRAIRSSDSFKRMLAKMVREKYGATINKVRQKGLETALVAMGTLQEIMQDDAVLPGAKMEAAKIALTAHENTQAREAPKTVEDKPGGVQVTINLSPGELDEARKNMVSHGQNIQLEASNVPHTPFGQQPRLLQRVEESGT